MSTENKMITEEIIIPDNVTVSLDNDVIKVSGPLGINEIKFKDPKVNITKEENKLVLRSKQNNRNKKKTLMTLRAHLNNIIKGVLKNYTYKLKICSGHFPMNVSVSNDKIIIKNFFAEKIPRQAKIFSNVKVSINSDIITVTGINKEAVGQTAANIEQACRITNRDRRIFMDGIYIISKEE